jgi:hypothetical protein
MSTLKVYRMRRLLLFMLLMTTCLLVACDPPTAPAVTPTDAVSAQLTESYSGTDMLNGELSFRYPAGWGAKANETGLQVQFASDPALLTNIPDSVPAGQLYMFITMSPGSLVNVAVPEGETLTPEKFLQAFIESDKAAGSTLPYGEITPTTLAGKSAARVTATGEDGAVLVVVVALPDGYALISGTTPPTELAKSEPIMLAIAGSVEYIIGAE